MVQRSGRRAGGGPVPDEGHRISISVARANLFGPAPGRRLGRAWRRAPAGSIREELSPPTRLLARVADPGLEELREQPVPGGQPRLGSASLLAQSPRLWMRAILRWLRRRTASVPADAAEQEQSPGEARDVTWLPVLPGIVLERGGDDADGVAYVRLARKLLRPLRRTAMGAELLREFDPASPWNPISGREDDPRREDNPRQEGNRPATVGVRIDTSAGAAGVARLSGEGGFPILSVARADAEAPNSLDSLVASALCRIYLDRIGLGSALEPAELDQIAAGVGPAAAWYYTANRYCVQAGRPPVATDPEELEAARRPPAPLADVLQAMGREQLATAAPWGAYTTRWS